MGCNGCLVCVQEGAGAGGGRGGGAGGGRGGGAGAEGTEAPYAVRMAHFYLVELLWSDFVPIPNIM